MATARGAMSKGVLQAKLKLLERFMPDASEAQIETMEILMDLDQVSSMLSSLDEMRKGQIVSMSNAFADL
ncbi:MAG: hypothetical protein K2X01_08860 [Cyanobacteria bacterium]|nr:hypothetical protein [Cyanobacteriota bacterium]